MNPCIWLATFQVIATSKELTSSKSYNGKVSEHFFDYGPFYPDWLSFLSPSEQYIQLTQSKQRLSPATIDAIFDQLPPVTPSQLLGSWNGGYFDTGHHIGETLKEIKWVGKDFFSTEHVDPVIVERDGQRSSWGQWGLATVCFEDDSAVRFPRLTHISMNQSGPRSQVPQPSVEYYDLW